MSVYTTQVRWIVEQAANDPELTIAQKIEKACPLIFNFDYPIWNAEYKPVLEKKILRHYFNKEIGLETVGLWKFYLESRLNEIMPYYNKLYLSEINYDILTDISEQETVTREKTGNENASYNGKNSTEQNSTTNSTEKRQENGENSSKTEYNSTVESSNTDASQTDIDSGKNSNVLESDTPQANYAGKDYATRLVTDTETSYSNTTQSGSSSGNSTSSGTDKASGKTSNTGSNTYEGKNNTDSTTDMTSTNDIDRSENEEITRKRTGSTGRLSFPELIMKYRESLINIDMMIIDDLQDLFMMIY